MKNDFFIKKCLQTLSLGQAFRPKKPTYITASDLRALLLGISQPAKGIASNTIPPPVVELEGSKDAPIVIIPDESTRLGGACDTTGCENDLDILLDLSNLVHPNGGALPPLVLKGCRIEGVLDIRRTHLAGLELYNCRLRGVLGDGAQIDNDCNISLIAPLNEEPRGQHDPLSGFPEMVSNCSSPCVHPEACQIRLIGCRIDGAFTIRHARLYAPYPADWKPRAGTPPRHLFHPESVRSAYGNHFALTLANSEIGGRLWIGDTVEAIGGISVYQAKIDGSLRMDAALIAVHKALEPPEATPRNFLAFSGDEVRVGGSLRWGRPPSISGDREDHGRVFGVISLVRAQIANDLNFEKCVFLECLEEGTRRGPPVNEESRGAAVSGGIDLRRASIGGQFSIYKPCRIGRRNRTMSGRRMLDRFGPAIDAWKANFELGILIEPGALICGPVHFNACHIGRETVIAGAIVFSAPLQENGYIDNDRRTRPPEWHYPYDLALSFADSIIDGHLALNLARASGRVMLERARVTGSVEVQQISFAGLNPLRADPAIRAGAPLNEMSIFDMQDFSVGCGINLKQGALSVEAPHAHHDFHIVDMRGMICASWDDADATCWQGLHHAGKRFSWRRAWAWATQPFRQARRGNRTPPEPGSWYPLPWGENDWSRSGTRWRLRFEGLTFGRLDSSVQTSNLEPRATRGHYVVEALRRTAGKYLFDAAGKPAGPMRLYPAAERSYQTVGRDEALRFRLQALTSYGRNRAPLEAKEGSGWWRGLPRWIGNWAYRWTIQPSWQRRETIPHFSPSPFDQFARAYLAEGETWIATRILVSRMDHQWRRRLRLASQRYFYWAPWLVLLSIALLAAGLGAWSFIPPLGPLVLLASIGLAILIYRFGFSYGLNAIRAVAAGMAFVALCAFIPEIADKAGFFGRPGTVAFADPWDRLAFGLDKLVPADINREDDPTTWLKQTDPGKAVAIVHSHETAQLAKATGEKPDPVVQPHQRERRFRFLSGVLDVLGWIVIALVVLTISGVLRREIERR